jgi:hypothetical protein
LKLLPNFVADMPIVGVQLLQFAGEGVNVGGGESRRRREESAIYFRFPISDLAG